MTFPEGLWKPGTTTLLDERLTDVESYRRRQSIECEQIQLVVDKLLELEAEIEGAAR